MTNLKLILLALGALIIVGIIVAFGLKSRRLRMLAAKLLQAQGDLAAQPIRTTIDKEKKTLEVIDVKRKEAL